MLGQLAGDGGVFWNVFGTWQMSPYRHCSIGCVYCNVDAPGASRPVLPEGELLAAVREKIREIPTGGFLGVGAPADPYPPEERALGLTRRLIALLTEEHTDFVLLTRSPLVLRDLDLLAGNPRCKVVDLSVSTSNDEQIARLEPGASTYAERRDAILALAAAGVPTIVAASPWIPDVSVAARILEDFAGKVPVIFRALDLGEGRPGASVRAARFFAGLTQRDVNRAYLAAALEAGSPPGVSWMAPPGMKGGDALFSAMTEETTRGMLEELGA
jgi:hypothetical protein